MQTVLLAFNSKQLSVIMEKMLDDLGFKCFCANAAKELPDDVSEKNPAVVFTDWTFDGQDMTSILPDLSPKPVIIFVSQEKDPKKIQKALNAGVDEYIMKPFDNDILQSKLSLAGVL